MNKKIKETIKTHIPDFHQWHEHCQKQVIELTESMQEEIDYLNKEVKHSEQVKEFV